MGKKVFNSDSWNEFSAGIKSLKSKSDATNIAYGTCTTSAATATKVISIVGNTQWKLVAGSRITIKFSYTNTASNPTFNVNGTGAKSVWYNTGLITTSNLSYAGYTNRPMNFVYDGTQYVFQGWSLDNNSDTKVSQVLTTATSQYPILLAYSNNATTTATVTNTARRSNNVYVQPSTGKITATTFVGSLSGNASSATYATSADSSSKATSATSATYATTATKAGTATYGTNSGTSTYAKNAGTASKLSGLTATVSELNYVDGVTSNIQTQLNNKLTCNVVTTLPSTGANGALYIIK